MITEVTGQKMKQNYITALLKVITKVVKNTS